MEAGVEDPRKAVDVQEVRRAQVCVAVGVVGLDAGGVDDDLDRAVFQRVGHGQGAAESAKSAMDLREAEVDRRRRHCGVDGIVCQIPGAGATVAATLAVDYADAGLRIMPAAAVITVYEPGPSPTTVN